jgi:hypothetical protein
LQKASESPSSGLDAFISSASERLIATAAKLQRTRQLRSEDDEYYGEDHRDEEPIDDMAAGEDFDAVITRNHYGCLILNANSALFVDVDVDIDGSSSPYRRKRTYGDPARIDPATVLNDLRTVLAGEADEGFRIYRTAAGFRVLATSNAFDPDSAKALRLMNSVGSDWHFSRLCATQHCFRARLTPKPWRCGVKRPPNPFPRHSIDEQRCFDAWLLEYEPACRDRATCRFLEHVGPASIHECVAPIVEFHDRHTRALESLPLA